MAIKILFEEIDNYLSKYTDIKNINEQNAKNDFRKEWKEVCSYNNGAEKYGKALIIYSIVLEKSKSSQSDIEKLEILIKEYDIQKGSEYKMANKESLFFNLGICWTNLGCDGKAIEAYKKYLFYLFSMANNTTYSNIEAYAFRNCGEYTYKSLINEQLNLSSPSVFNDPFDCPIVVLLKKYDDKVNNLILKAYNECLKIACFSRRYKLESYMGNDGYLDRHEKHSGGKEEYLNELMWAHYADCHKGICIKFHFRQNMTKMITNSNKEISYFKDTIYSDKAMSNYSGSVGSISVDDSIFLKGQCWEYENELRYMNFDINGSGTHKQIDIPNCIAAVYFGLKCSQENKDTIIKILKGRKWKEIIPANLLKKTPENEVEKDIEFFQMEMDQSHFGQLIAKKISPYESNITFWQKLCKCFERIKSFVNLNSATLLQI